MLLVHYTCIISTAFGPWFGTDSGPDMLRPGRIKSSQWPVSELLPAFVDVAVADGHDENEQHVVVDLVDDSVVTCADTPLAAAQKLLGATGARFAREQLDRSLYATLRRPVELTQLSYGCRGDLDAVGHASPRSALT